MLGIKDLLTSFILTIFFFINISYIRNWFISNYQFSSFYLYCSFYSFFIPMYLYISIYLLISNFNMKYLGDRNFFFNFQCTNTVPGFLLCLCGLPAYPLMPDLACNCEVLLSYLFTHYAVIIICNIRWFVNSLF